jgi:hypothetical protein
MGMFDRTPSLIIPATSMQLQQDPGEVGLVSVFRKSGSAGTDILAQIKAFMNYMVSGVRQI